MTTLEWHDQSGGRRQGFTLIELAIVVVIIGVVISIVTVVLPSLIQTAKVKKARAILEKMDFTIEGYIAANGRCPCPDTDGDGQEDRNDAGTPADASDDTCTAYVGDLPYLTLGLSAGTDNWQNPIRYAVFEDFIRTASTNLCTSLNGFITAAFDNTKLHTTDAAGNTTNQAYVVVTGAAKDLDDDAADGFFDGFNEGADLQFDDPNRIEFHGTPVANRYDDLMRAAAFAYLNGKLCTGGPGGGSPGSTAGENTFPSGCSNGVDDDGDGYTDCLDQDCFGIAPCGASGTLTITTATLPTGPVNSDYAAAVQAAGGITPYEWALPDSGGFASLFLHTYTGQMSGRLDQCPGTYSVQVQAGDSTLPGDGGPLSDNKNFDIQVTTDLVINRTSGAGTNITWSTPTQEETFEATGGHLGSITWSLATTATGFSVASTGSDTCVLTKSGTSTPGTFPFTITATDAACPGNTASIILTVEILASGASAPYTAKQEAAWTLDECLWDGTSGEVVDEGSTGLDGTAQNGADTRATGKICRAGGFDGLNDYVSMGDVLNNVFGPGSNTFTVAAWINPSNLSAASTNHGTRNCFIAKASDPANDNLEIGVNVNGTLHVYIDSSGQDRFADFGTPGDIAVNRWSFVAVTYNNGSVSIALNANKYTDASTWSGGGNLDNAAGSPFTIGSSQHIDNYFSGKIDEVYVFNDALTDTEVDDLYTATRGTCTGTCYTGPVAEYRMDEAAWSGTGTIADVLDTSGNAWHGTSYYGVDTTATGQLCRAGVFTDQGGPNNNDRVKLPYQVGNALQDFTAMLWINTTKNGSQGIISGANGSQSNEWLLFSPNSASLNTFVKGPSRSYATTVSDGTWHHFTWMREGSREWLLADGGIVGTNTVSGAAISIAADGLWLGSEQDSVAGGWDRQQELVGTLDEVRFYDRALSENEIRAHINLTRTCN
jgi:prepilin-type N-terminal cleavage/methylation domain-containing protein